MSSLIDTETVVYIVRNRDGHLNKKKGFLHKDGAMSYILDLASQYGNSYEDYYIEDVVVPFLGQNIYYIHLYRGFDYNYGSGMSDVTNAKNEKFFACKDHAKEDPLWKKYEDISQKDPENHHISDTKICSDEYGEEWFYGDVMEGKFEIEILPIKISRKLLSDYDRNFLSKLRDRDFI